jgi:hypothetical protein
MSKDAKVLRRAAELVEMGWCQHAPARDADGNEVSPTRFAAIAWDWAGAVERAHCEIHHVDPFWRYDPSAQKLPGDVFAPYTKAMAPILKERWGARRGFNSTAWNNAPERKTADVIDVLRAAADRCEAAS